MRLKFPRQNYTLWELLPATSRWMVDWSMEKIITSYNVPVQPWIGGSGKHYFLHCPCGGLHWGIVKPIIFYATPVQGWKEHVFSRFSNPILEGSPVSRFLKILTHSRSFASVSGFLGMPCMFVDNPASLHQYERLTPWQKHMIF